MRRLIRGYLNQLFPEGHPYTPRSLRLTTPALLRDAGLQQRRP
ncbi:MAG: hypothetical protein AB1486_32895 [Planctomycetota bacterium]